VYSVTAGDGGSVSGDAGGIDLIAGTAPGTGDGGSVSLTAGSSSGGGAGGDINVTTGSATAGNADGGNIDISMGDGFGTGSGGGIFYLAGTGGATGGGGSVALTAGSGGATSGNGGSLTFSTGFSPAASSGGDVLFDIGGSTSGAGGDFTVISNSGGTAGGDISFTAGTGITTTGGDVELTAGDGATTGGNIILTPGSGGVPADDGTVSITGQAISTVTQSVRIYYGAGVQAVPIAPGVLNIVFDSTSFDGNSDMADTANNRILLPTANATYLVGANVEYALAAAVGDCNVIFVIAGSILGPTPIMGESSRLSILGGTLMAATMLIRTNGTTGTIALDATQNGAGPSTPLNNNPSLWAYRIF
jgi:hypothetical protein